MCKPNQDVRELFGMRYQSIEVAHPVSDSLSSVLHRIADWLEDTGNEHVLPTSLTTQSDPDDDSTFLTTFVWAV